MSELMIGFFKFKLCDRTLTSSRKKLCKIGKSVTSTVSSTAALEAIHVVSTKKFKRSLIRKHVKRNELGRRLRQLLRPGRRMQKREEDQSEEAQVEVKTSDLY